MKKNNFPPSKTSKQRSTKTKGEDGEKHTSTTQHGTFNSTCLLDRHIRTGRTQLSTSQDNRPLAFGSTLRREAVLNPINMTPQTMRSRQASVSNTEIDWFLRGTLPEDHSPMPVPHKHQETAAAITHDTMQRSNTPVPLRPVGASSPAQESLGHVLTRSRSLPSECSQQKKKGGFFKSIFSKKKDDDSSRSSSPVPTPLRPQTCPLESDKPNHMQRSKSLAGNSDLDPKLEEFLRYYKAKGLQKLHQDLELQQERRNSVNSPLSDNSSISSSINSALIIPKTPTIKRLDVLGRPIPAHPARAALPPAIVKLRKLEPKPEESTSSVPSTSRLGFLRRHHSSSSERTVSRPASRADSRDLEPQQIIIPGLENLPKLKRVSFDIPVFYNDPPQQIPSRAPRKGEVEILKDGSIVIHKLSLAEKRQLLQQGGGGIVVGGSGHFKITTNADKANGEVSPTSPTSVDGQAHAAQQHSIEVAAAEAAAEARGKEGPNELKRTTTNNEDEVGVNRDVSKINIDKPMVRHNKSSSSLATVATTMNIEEDGAVFPPPNVKVPLDTLYTRCCHLREILPIPATMKQIKPNSTDPIPLLQLRNPKPSLVEVLTFSDFISIAPVLCISLDGVCLSSEMLRIILSALVAKKEFEKLTLRNTPIDDLGWRLLCWFLTKNHSMSRIDLTNVPTLRTNVQKPCKTAVPSSISRMESDMTSRSDMNWNLFNAALMSRNGIEELVINGAKMSDEEFDNLIEMGVSLNTGRLGLAYNDLTERQLVTLATKLDFSKIMGLDLGYNDLSDKIEAFITSISEDRIRNASFKFLSLNSCNLKNTGGILDHFISMSTGLRELRYLDLSNNKELFPSIMVSLTQCLPLFPRLARIHLEYNNLSQNTIIAFAELIPFCKSLSYISLLGNHMDSVSSSSLANAMKLSTTVMTLDLDFDEVPNKVRDAIGLYTVRNMQRQISSSNQVNGEELDNLLSGLSDLLSDHAKEKTDQLFTETLLRKVLKVRKRIHESIDELFKVRIQGELNTEGKEALIRFCYLDSSIEKGLHLLAKRSGMKETMQKLQNISGLREGGTSLAHTNPMTRGSSANIILSDYMDSSGHAELMPFGVSQTHADHSETQELTDGSDFTRSNDNHHLKEEGSVLKLSGLIKSSGIAKRIEKEQRDVIDNLSGDSIRQAMLDTDDLTNVIQILDKLKEKGVGIGEIYKKSEQPNSSDYLDIETLKNTTSNVAERETIVDSGSDSDTSESEDAEPEDHELSHAYDEILDRLERVRTSN